jgi:hypothetical protein
VDSVGDVRITCGGSVLSGIIWKTCHELASSREHNVRGEAAGECKEDAAQLVTGAKRCSLATPSKASPQQRSDTAQLHHDVANADGHGA